MGDSQRTLATAALHPWYAYLYYTYPTLKRQSEEAREEGLERGRHEERLELIRKMLSKGLSLEVVSDVTGLSLEELDGLLS